MIGITSSGTARTLVKPFRKTTKTFRAPHRRAEVAQSKAVSPAPRTITLPRRDGSSWLFLQAHIPGLLPFATTGRKFFEVKKPIFDVKFAKIDIFFGSGNPIPKKIALYPAS